jgi:hypothetical protein
MSANSDAVARLIEVLKSARARKAMYLSAVRPEACINFLVGVRIGLWASTGLDWPVEARWAVLDARGLEMSADWEDGQLAARGLEPEQVVDELLAIEVAMWTSWMGEE